MRSSFLCAIALFLPTSLALDRDINQCAANVGGVAAGGSFVAKFVNPGLNPLTIFACSSSAPTNETCAPSSPSSRPCDLTVPSNSSEFYVNFSAAATAATLVYRAAQPYLRSPPHIKDGGRRVVEGK